MDFNEKLCHILDKAQRNLKKGLSNERNLIEFRIYLYQISSINDIKDASGMNLFQKACGYGLHEHVQRLLMDYECDPDCITPECSSTGLLLAAYNGFDEVFKVIKEHKLNKEHLNKKKASFSALEKGSGKSILHLILNKTMNGNYEKCVDLILDPALSTELKKIINHKDEENNAPLHYATELWPQNIIRKLMELGANVGVRNVWDETPISLILPETMESFLDEFCLQSKGESTQDDFELKFDYSFLAPPVQHPVLFLKPLKISLGFRVVLALPDNSLCSR